MAPAVGRPCRESAPAGSQTLAFIRQDAERVRAIPLTVGRTILLRTRERARCYMLRVRLALTVGSMVAAWALAGPVVVQAGADRLTAPLARVRVSLYRGSDSGTICYDIVNPGDEPNAPQHSTHVELRTGPVDPDTGQPTGDFLFQFVLGPIDEISSACATGLDPAVVTDIFANPGDYHVTVADCFERIDCFWTSDPLAAEEETPPAPDPPLAAGPPATGPLPDTSSWASPRDGQPPVAEVLLGVGLLAAGMTLARRRRGA